MVLCIHTWEEMDVKLRTSLTLAGCIILTTLPLRRQPPDVRLHIFSTLALDRSEWSASCSNHFISRQSGLQVKRHTWHYMEIVSQLHIPFYLWVKSTQQLLDRKMGGLQSSSRHGSKEKNPCPFWESNHNHSASCWSVSCVSKAQSRSVKLPLKSLCLETW